jgi:hypothetical protein
MKKNKQRLKDSTLTGWTLKQDAISLHLQLHNLNNLNDAEYCKVETENNRVTKNHHFCG